ncbi:NUDIX domain-containing protein [Halorussus amylolyticus]|uniref:NUDIX domain-containing protein n=1 Tax=Halorussus amylolyticus TaxID=1126242 RepID=UPI001049CFCB|nr:NUDIX domain-containing protein [Halorussus amylolyticus]
MTEWISDDDWATIVRHVPIVSVDLVVKCDAGIVLGERQNEPAKGEWFVPGGRVQKHETLREAVYRVAEEELGIEVDIVERLGAYEHFYETADVSEAGGKHYLANGFVVEATTRPSETDAQHSELRAFEELPTDLHEYTRDYLVDTSGVEHEL